MQWIRSNLAVVLIVLAGLVTVLVLSLAGAPGESLTWAGLAIGVVAGVAIAIASRDRDG